ncbi:Altered inheritance of mitochondria 6 protein [Rutstroemia sp. NJR-2017a BBW]|nr:Altered inheritance of mitochondria 6 protein [Rutstroemia sp. NJR-2017a BBW]
MWLSLIVTVVNRLHIPLPNNGLQQILKRYTPPNETHAADPTWVDDFSSDVLPVSCHSHNDYLHRVPLYEGLAAGCISTEADIWPRNNSLRNGELDLLVSHTSKRLKETRTLRSLYLDPLMNILQRQNDNSSSTTAGVFSMSPNASLTLLLDFKETDNITFDLVSQQLEPFRAVNWLTYWTPATGITERPITIVATGSAPFDRIISNSTYRDIFYDAPIDNLSNNQFHANNSYYASGSLRRAVGLAAFGHLTAKQEDTVRSQVQLAEGLGLKTRYWDTPSWPISFRNKIWSALEELGVRVLNVDDLTAATRWDWRMCVVGGLVICDG